MFLILPACHRGIVFSGLVLDDQLELLLDCSMIAPKIGFVPQYLRAF